MSRVILERYRSDHDLGVAVAEALAAAIAQKPDIVFGLPAGRTPILVYRELVALSRARRLDWSRVRTFSLDEFITAPDGDRLPYQGFMHQHLYASVNMLSGNIHGPDGRAPDPEAECARYERAIDAAGGLDVVLLGIGVHGHIAFNEPGSRLSARTHVAELAPLSRASNAFLFDGHIDRVPTHAISMGMATICGARKIVLVAAGREKAGAVRLMFSGGITSETPATLLQLHRDVTVMVDDAAGADV
jgi:glucosamine-6-phosphate deaminase